MTVERRLNRPGEADNPSLLRMLLQYWWVVILILAAFVGLAFLFDATQRPEFEARAELIVEDPRASRLFEVTDLSRPSTQASERYLADQVEILRSAEVANVASELLDGRFSPTRILLNRSIQGDLTSNLIEVFFTADSRDGAQEGANAIANAYQEVRRSQVQATAAVALEKVDALLAALDEELDQIDERIAEVRAGDAALQELNRQFSEAQQELNTLRMTRNLLPVGSERRAEINAQIDELLRDFSTWEVVLRISERGSELDSLLAEKDAAVAEQATLVARANSIEVDAELAAGGVTLFSPAQPPLEPSGISFEIVLAVALVLGLVTSGIVAYYLTLRRVAVMGRRVPRAVLDAPLLAEVPHFDLEGIQSSTPVIDVPGSAAAEAFRFAASAVHIRAAASEIRLIAVVSASRGSGRTVAVANIGLASAAAGFRTLALDADFGEQGLTHALVGATLSAGMTDVVDGRKSIDDAVTQVPAVGGQMLSMLSRGSRQVDAEAYLGTDRAKEFFSAVRSEFDLTLIDGPPLLLTSYAGTLAQYADAAVVVVEHGSDVADLRQLRSHLTLLDTPILGYVYTKAPVLPPALARKTGQAVEAETELEETADARPADAKVAGSAGSSTGA